MSGCIRYMAWFLLYCGLHYIEGYPPMGGLPVAQLWKLPLLAYLLLLTIRSRKRKFAFEKSIYGFSIISTLNVESLSNPLYSLAHAMKQLPLVLFFRFWIHKFDGRVARLERIMYSLAQFVLLSSLVVLIGLVSPIGGFISADSFGVDSAIYYSGILGSPHAASSYFVAAILILLDGFVRKRFGRRLERWFNFGLILIGLVSVFQAYVRTGWLMLLLGVVVMLLPKRVTLHRVIKFGALSLVLIGGLVYFYETNEQFKARILGRNVYTEASSESIDVAGSGRTSFWLNGIEGWSEGSMYELFFGQGYTKVVERNLEKTGLRVFSHNQFVDSLAEHGLFGLFFLVGFFVCLYVFIRRHRHSEYYRLNMALFFSAVIFAFFQNEMYFDYMVMFSLSLALLVLSDSQPLKNNQYAG